MPRATKLCVRFAAVVVALVTRGVVTGALLPTLDVGFPSSVVERVPCAQTYSLPSSGLFFLALDEGEANTYYEYTEPIDSNSDWTTGPNSINKARHRLRWEGNANGVGYTLSLEVLLYPTQWVLLADVATTFAPPSHTSSDSEALIEWINSLLGSATTTGAEWALHRPGATSACILPVRGTIGGDRPDAFQQLHKVAVLPGWNQPLPSDLFAGSVPISDTGFGRRFIHYMFATAERQPTSPPTIPQDVPVILWLQGGPGCSAKAGLFTEVGQFRLRGSSNATLERNPYSWTRFAHVLAIDAPVGVGFSMSEGLAGPAHLTDESTAQQNWQFLQRLLSAFFPHLADNPFFIAGESYGGVFVPTLADTIVRNHRSGHDKLVRINLQGIVVGNGCAGQGARAAIRSFGLTENFSAAVCTILSKITMVAATELCGIDPVNTDFKRDFSGQLLQLLHGRGLISSAVHSNILQNCDKTPANLGFPKGYTISHGLPSCYGLTKQPLCGMQPTDYFNSFVPWLLAMDRGDRSHFIPSCLGRISSLETAAMDALDARAAQLLQPLQVTNAQQLLQVNNQIWSIIFGLLQEQSSALLHQYSLTDDNTFLIGSPGSTPAWLVGAAQDPLGRIINRECCAALANMTAAVGLIDIYDTSDQQCKGGPLPSGTWYSKATNRIAKIMSDVKARAVAAQIEHSYEYIEAKSSSLFDLDPCGGSFENLMQYFNSPAVMAALHAPYGRNDGVHGWGICTDFGETQGSYSYTKTVDVAPYADLLSGGGIWHDNAINISIYSGDTDACVPFPATVDYFSGVALTLGLHEEKAWQPWLVGGQVGGYATEWSQVSSRLSVTTVRGAGHMVPLLRPKQALALIYRAVYQLGWDDESTLSARGSIVTGSAVSGSTLPQTTLSIVATRDETTVFSSSASGGRFSLGVGASVSLQVHAPHISLPLVFSWSHNGQSLAGVGAPDRVTGALDATLVLTEVKPADAGLRKVEVWDVLGGFVGSMDVYIAVTLTQACPSQTGACHVSDSTNLCPEEWVGDGECDRALCPGGDAQDCDATSLPGLAQASCTTYAEVSKHLNDLQTECCNQPSEDCSTGVPLVCNAGCAAVLLPMVTACTGYLSSSNTPGLDGAALLVQLNQLAAICHAH